MPYDPIVVQPMRDELTSAGIQELLTPEAVDEFMSEKTGTVMIVVNSVCGCSAGGARPAIRMALRNDSRPDRLASVFAGQDIDATERARAYFGAAPPSSPSMALFKDGALVHFVPREAIQGRDPEAVAFDLVSAFDRHCATPR